MTMKLPVDPDESRLVLGMKDFAPFFIYKKDDLYKVLHYKQAASGGHIALIGKKWTHCATIEPLQWIESLLNDDAPSRFLHFFMKEGNDT